jgi:bacterioferritin-associated ferredoxin
LTVECGRCRRETTIANFTGTLESGDPLLVGKCGECRGDVARVIDGS